MTKKEKRLLGAVETLQGLIGRANSANNDRNPNRYAEVTGYLARARKLAMEVRGDFTSDECENAGKLFEHWTTEETFI